jgi:glycosyltransferase involved in cell wall biosynthesis
MRIGFSTSVIQRGKTGIAQHVFALLREMELVAIEHQFVLYILEEDIPLFKELGDKFERVVVEEKWRPAVRNIVWHQTKLPGLARKHRLDVVHVPSYRRLLWNAPCPRVATIHDLAPFHVSGKYDVGRMFYGKVVVKRLARRQDKIIAISRNTARDIERFFGISQSEVQVIHNGLEHHRFFPGNRELAKKVVAERFGLSKPFFLYVARLEHPAKNHVRLIEAFEQFKRGGGADWQLAFGGSDWHGAEVIHERIKNSAEAGSIKSLGFIKDAELPDLYRAAECFVYPSMYEGFGLPPVEAMACGTPVISSSRGALEEVVADAAVIVEPEDVGSISRALQRMAQEARLREEMRVRGKLRAKQFDWKGTAEQTLGVYTKAVMGWRHRNIPAKERIRLASASF